MYVNALLVTMFSVVGISSYLLVPRLVFRPQFEARLRRLRDEVFDAQYTDALPFDHPDVMAFVNEIGRSISASRRVSLPRSLVRLGAVRLLQPKRLTALAPNYELIGMDSEERQLFESYQRRLFYIETKMTVFSTWPSIVLSVPWMVALVLGFPLTGDAWYDRNRVLIEKGAQVVAEQESLAECEPPSSRRPGTKWRLRDHERHDSPESFRSKRTAALTGVG